MTLVEPVTVSEHFLVVGARARPRVPELAA
jgi:hypothetical protein